MKTIEQVEREHAACYGRYYPEYNYYEQISEPVEYFQCDFCGLYFEEEELKEESEGLHLRYCSDCEKYADTGVDREKQAKEEAEDEKYRIEMISLFSEMDENEKRIIRAIDRLNKAV